MVSEDTFSEDTFSEDTLQSIILQLLKSYVHLNI